MSYTHHIWITYGKEESILVITTKSKSTVIQLKRNYFEYGVESLPEEYSDYEDD
tara:strand:+ start:1178 stop:1339 length:162 start_codon:yes stop_codon:yes gene_type:complete